MRKVIIPILIGLVAVSGCVQPASNQTAPTQIGLNATFTAIPSNTPTETDLPVDALTEEVIADVTATPTPSDTATATLTATPTPTDAQSALLQLEGTAVAQEGAPPIEGGGEVTDPGQQPGINPFEQTATAIVAGATQTEAARLTQAAIDAGIGLPTFTPTPTAITGDPGAGGGQITPIPSGANCIHEVRAQDQNLYRLSLAYGVTVADIVASSPDVTNPNLIVIGDRLVIPGCGTTGGRPPATSTPGPTFPGGGTGGAVPPSGDCSWGTTVIFPSGCNVTGANVSGSIGTVGDSTAGGGGGTGGPVVGGGRTHTVQQGETLFEISLLYGVPVETIAAANGISNYNYIQLGTQLVIP